MKATIEWNNTTITGKNLNDLRQQMNGMLAVEGPRALSAVTDNGTEIVASLYTGESYIRTADGRTLYSDKH